MRWEELANHLPFVPGGGTPRVTVIYPELGLEARQPGKYAAITGGGDFKVVYRGVAPTHQEKFWLVEQFAQLLDPWILRDSLISVLLHGHSPLVANEPSAVEEPVRLHGVGVSWRATLAIYQAIGLAEERRYPTAHLGGGRFLPFNFARLLLGGWTSVQRIGEHEKRGLPGLQQLEREVTGQVPAASRRRLTSTGWRPLWG